MKTIALLFIVITLGLTISGCSRSAPTEPGTPDNTALPQEQAGTDTISMDDIENTPNPDIGTLDDTAVSEELPQ